MEILRCHTFSFLSACTLLIAASGAPIFAADLPHVTAVYTESGNNILRSFSLDTGAVHESAPFDHHLSSISISPDRRRIAATDEAGQLFLVDAKSLAIIAQIPLNARNIGSFVPGSGLFARSTAPSSWSKGFFWSEDSTRLTLVLNPLSALPPFARSGRYSKTAELMQIQSSDGQVLGSYPLRADGPVMASWVRKEDLLILGYGPPNVRGGVPTSGNGLALVDLKNLSATKRLELPGSAAVMVLSSDGNTLYIPIAQEEKAQGKGVAWPLVIASLNPFSILKTVDESTGYVAWTAGLATGHILIGAWGAPARSPICSNTPAHRNNGAWNSMMCPWTCVSQRSRAAPMCSASARSSR
jgi:hypothetical protein